MVSKNNNIVVPIKIQEANIPIIYNSYVTSAQKKRHGPLLRSGMAFIILDSLDFFGYLITDIYRSGTEGEVMRNGKLENFSQFCVPFFLFLAGLRVPIAC